MNDRICIVFFFLVLTGTAVSQPAFEMGRHWDGLLKEPGFRHAQAGIQITDTETGKTIFEHNSDRLFIPASVMKLVTSASALEILGPDYRFQTRLGYSGIVEGTTLRGDLVVTGGGDPALGSEYFRDHYFLTHFLDTWAQKIHALGIRRVEGNLLLDVTWFDGEKIPPTWTWEDMGNYFGAGSSALAVYDNLFRISFRSPVQAGRPTEILSVTPEVQGLEFRNEVVSSDDNRDNAWVFGSPADHVRVIRGTIPKNRKVFTIKASNPFPEKLLATDFISHLARTGIFISGKTISGKTEPDAFKPVYFAESPSLAEIVKVLNHESVNLFAEQLVKQMAAENEVPGTREAGLKMISGYWENKGLDSRQLFMEDGSGLSHFNAVTPAFLCSLLNYMNRTNLNSSVFYESLPGAGEGTLTGFSPRLFSGENLRAKSGSMNRVRSYAGYYTSASGKKYSFALMVNHYFGPSQLLLSCLEKMISELERI